MSLPAALAIIDVETTGARPAEDRITEIAILRVEAGRVTERWSSLVDPGMPIPPLIQSFTGISNAMVSAAPPFEALAGRVRELLEGAVFVAHNARFDYSFVRNAFRQLGQDFGAEVLCTVKLSRALYPQHRRHGLDALIERHGLACSARHRALGDAEALWSFLQQANEAFAPAALDEAVRLAMKRPARPPGLPDGVLEGLPASPGVYLLFGERRAAGEVPLYVGENVDLRSRVTAHFSASLDNGREAEMARQVRHVEVIETAGELGALLLEARLIRQHRPRYNRPLHDGTEVRGLRLLPNRRKPPVLERVALADSDPAAWQGRIFGTFRSKREIDNALRELALLYRLCPARLGLEAPAGGPCTARQAKRCAGVCAGCEKPAQHDARLAKALGALRARPWPWPGAVGLREFCADNGREQIHVVDHWCLLGSADDPPALAELLADRPPRRFDLDSYRIIERWLARPGRREQVIELDPRPGTRSAPA